MTDTLITAPQQWRAALEEAARRIRAGDVNGADQQADVMRRWVPPDAPHEELVAPAFQRAAAAASADGDAAAFEWLWRQALVYWGFWASCATSGGEGTARAREVADIEAQYQLEKRQLAERLRQAAGGYQK